MPSRPSSFPCFLASLLGLATATAQDSVPRELRYSWSPGTKLRYEVSSSMRGKLDIGVGDVKTQVPLDYDVSMGVALECDRVDARHLHHGRLAFEWIRIVEGQGGQRATFDTRDPEAIRDNPMVPLYRELLELTKQSLEFDVGAHGRPSFSIAARERLTTIGSPLDPAQLQVELARIFPDLPAELIAPGKSWKTERTIEMPTLGTLTLETHNHLASLAPTSARVELRFVPVVEEDVARAAAAGLPPLEIRKATGWQEFQGASGMLSEHLTELEVTLDLREEDLSLRGELRLRSHVKRL